MDFTFSAEQLEFRDTLSSLLQTEVTGERIRARWQSESGRDAALEQQLLEMGVYSLLFPESLGGLGMNTIDAVLLAEACGKAVLPEPLAETMMVASPLLVDVLDRGLGNGAIQSIIDQVMDGNTQVALAHPINPYLNYAASADWVLAASG
ncbi:MAG: acyl-CoA dehydrogenase family protein, partial [Actinobacteria bacterium]|nr:acyl-CoA dehydrogenase family protein [Actinomycetota bacterium]